MNTKDFFDIKDEVVKMFLFQEKHYKESDIIDVKLLSDGFTNVTCFLETKNHDKFAVRIGNELINRKNEWLYIILTKNTDYIYYNISNGNAIKKWIDGTTATKQECLDQSILIQVCDEIKKIQSIESSEIQEMSIKDYYQFMSIAQIDNEIKEAYKKLLNKYKNLELVIAHNDIRPANIIVKKHDDKKKIHIIDYEWSSLNNKYWDLANYIREIEYPFNEIETIIKNKFDYLDMNILKEFLFITTCYAVQWTFFPQESDELLAYRENALNLMNQYFKQYCKI